MQTSNKNVIIGLHCFTQINMISTMQYWFSLNSILCNGVYYLSRTTVIASTSIVPRLSDLEQGWGGTHCMHCCVHAFNFKIVNMCNRSKMTIAKWSSFINDVLPKAFRTKLTKLISGLLTCITEERWQYSNSWVLLMMYCQKCSE